MQLLPYKPVRNVVDDVDAGRGLGCFDAHNTGRTKLCELGQEDGRGLRNFLRMEATDEY